MPIRKITWYTSEESTFRYATETIKAAFAGEILSEFTQVTASKSLGLVLRPSCATVDPTAQPELPLTERNTHHG